MHIYHSRYKIDHTQVVFSFFARVVCVHGFDGIGTDSMLENLIKLGY